MQLSTHLVPNHSSPNVIYWIFFSGLTRLLRYFMSYIPNSYSFIPSGLPHVGQLIILFYIMGHKYQIGIIPNFIKFPEFKHAKRTTAATVCSEHSGFR